MRRRARAFEPWLLLFVALPLVACSEPGVRILCLGDSITQGAAAGPDRDATQSYRYPLWKMLVDRDVRFDLVGTQRGGFEGDPPWPNYRGRAFDRDHEGHYGWRTDQLLRKLPGWLEGVDADVALVHAGTNDLVQRQSVASTVDELRGVVAALRASNPEIVVILGQCMPDWPAYRALRAAVDALASELDTAESPVRVADATPGWVSDPTQPGALTFDWFHPNPAGDEKLAAAFLAALEPYLEQ